MSKHSIKIAPGQSIIIEITVADEVETRIRDDRNYIMPMHEIEKRINKALGLDIREKSRKTDYVMARQVFYYVANKVYKHSQNSASKFMDMDHASAHNALKKYNNLISVKDAKILRFVKMVQPHFPIKISNL